MNGAETIRVAGRALMKNKTRSFLTTLGIVIGVAAVIAVVALGEGAKAKVEEAFASMGTNVLIVLPGSTSTGGSRGGFGSMPTLTWDDLKAMQTEVPTVRYAAPQMRTVTQVLSEDQNWSTSVFGTTPDYFEIRNWKTASGSRFTQSDSDAGSKVAVIGMTVVEKLYGPNADPVGQIVRIKNAPFQIVGVLERKGQSAMGQDYDDCLIVPIKAYQTKIQGGLGKYIQGIIMISAISSDQTARAQEQLTALLRDRHHLQPGIEDDFFIRNLTEIASAQEQGAKTMSLLLACIAFVSLLVGGIGIMNIMLVSVTERTREIGVRMAIGARPGDILWQFLVEALTLSFGGGLIGMTLGVLIAQVIPRQFQWPTLIRPDSILIAMVVSAAIGIAFGLYPARKASRLDPIDALRYE